MNKIIFLILIIPILVFAQYGENVFVNQSFESFTGTEDDETTDDFAGWSETAAGASYVDASTTKVHGNYAVKLYHDGSNQAILQLQRSESDFNSTTWRVRFWTRGDGTGGLNLRYRDVTNSADRINWPDINTTTTYAEYDTSYTNPSNTQTILIYWRALSGAGEACWLDSIDWRIKLDTLYIDGINGSDTDRDTVSTLEEAMTNRGFHSDGYFKILPGNYPENIIIGENTTILGNLGDYSITQIDFNSKTVVCDYCVYQGILTVLNDENVILDYSQCSERDVYGKDYINYSKDFKGY